MTHFLSPHRWLPDRHTVGNRLFPDAGAFLAHLQKLYL